MFFGAVPREAISQVCRAVPFDAWRNVFVGCSGSFRFDRSVHEAHPSALVHSNDVSLPSCAIGSLAAGQPLALTFTGRLAFVEDHLRNAPPAARVAAVWVAQEMARYRLETDYARTHFQHYQDRFAEFLEPATAKTETLLGQLAVASFYPGDFRDQAQRALEADGGVAAFPPTYKGDYEKLYRFVEANTEWPRPDYRIWDPAQIGDWIDELDAMRVRYCVLVEHELPGRKPTTAFYGGIKPVFTYADAGVSSIRRRVRKAEPFRYQACDPAALTPKSRVEVVNATTPQMNFLKDIYLAKEIQHTTGIANFLVFLDGKLAGGFIFVRRTGKIPGLYMLCDFSLAPKSRLSKLIIMLASSATCAGLMERHLQMRIPRLFTTAYTDKPVSMKYRGLYELHKREPGKLHYVSQIRPEGFAGLYAEWWQRFVANARHPGAAAEPQTAGKKRALHEGAAVRAPGREHPAGRVPDELPAGA